MLIKVLARSRKERGHLLEQLTKVLLDQLGYTDFRSRLHQSGMQVDLHAKQKVTLTPLYCRSKATSREIRTQELRQAFTRYLRERRKAKNLIGLFLSFSGFHRAALEWYSKLENKAKSCFHLFGDDKVHAILRRAKLAGSVEHIENSVRSRTQAQLGPRYLVYLDGRFYWIQLLFGKKAMGYLVLDAYGEPVSVYLAKEIKQLDSTLEGKKFSNLPAREKVLLSLLDLGQKDVEFLAREIKEPIVHLREVMQELLREAIVVAEAGPHPRWRHDRYSLRPDFEVFLFLARQFLEGPHRFRFLGSKFAGQMLEAGLPSYIERRFGLNVSEQERTGFHRLLSVSPSALQFILSLPNEAYLHAGRNLEARPTPSQEREKWQAFYLSRLYADVLLRLLADAENPNFSALLGSKGVKTFLYRISAKAATPRALLFSLQADSYIPKPESPMVRPQSPDASLENGLAFLHMQEYDSALDLFEAALKEMKDPDQLALAWDGKGLCLLHQKRYALAIDCFNESLRYDSNSKAAWLHKAICLKELRDAHGALRCCKRSLEIDPAYQEAKAFLRIL